MPETNENFILISTYPGEESYTLSLFMNNAAKYGIKRAFPVGIVYDIVAESTLKGLDIRLEANRDKDIIASALTLPEIKGCRFKKKEKPNFFNSSSLINTDIGEEKIVVKKLKKIKGVTEDHSTYGIYDVYTKFEAKTPEKLKEIYDHKIRGIAGIRSTLELKIINDGGFIVDEKGRIKKYPLIQ